MINTVHTRKRLTRSILESIVGMFWGILILYTCIHLSINLSGHPLSPVFIVLTLILLLFTPSNGIVMKVPFKLAGILHIGVSLLIVYLIPYSSLLYKIIPGTSGNLTILFLIADTAAAALFFSLPVITSRPLQKKIDSPSAILTGAGMGIFICSAFLSRVLPETACIAFSALPTILIILLIKTPRKNPEKIPEREFPHFMTGWAFFLSLGNLFLTGYVVRVFTGLTYNSVSAFISVTVLCAGLGSIFGRRLIPLFQAPLSSAAGILSGTAAVSGIALCSLLNLHGLFTSPRSMGNPVDVFLLSLVCAGIHALSTGILFRLLTERKFSFSGKDPLGGKWYILIYLFPFCFSLISIVWSVVFSGIITVILGITASLISADRTETKVSVGIISGSLVLVIASLFSPSLFIPPSLQNNVLTVSASAYTTTPDYTGQTFQTLETGEYGTGVYCVLRDRGSDRQYVYNGAELLFPDEFLNDDIRLPLILPAVLTSQEGNVLYSGPDTPLIRETLRNIYPGTITAALLFPRRENHFTDRDTFKVITRNLRGCIQTTGKKYRAVICIAPAPSSPLSRNLHTVEYFRKTKSVLDENGIVIHILPFYKLIPQMFNSVISAFREVFQNNSSLWVYENYAVLAGGPALADLNSVRIKGQFSNITGKTGFSSVEELLASFCVSGSRLSKTTLPAPLQDTSSPLFHYASEARKGKYIFHNYQYVTSLQKDFSELLPDWKDTSVPTRYIEGRILLSQARQAWMLGDIEEAEKLIAKGISRNSEDTVLKTFRNHMTLTKALSLADSHHEKNQLDQALEYYLKAEESGRLPYQVYNRISDLYMGLSGQNEWPAEFNYARLSLQYTALSLSLNQNGTTARSKAIQALLKLKLLKRAQQVLGELRALDPVFPGLEALTSDASDQRKRFTRKTPPEDLANILIQAYETLLHSDNRDDINQSISRLITGEGGSFSIIEDGFNALSNDKKKRILHFYSRVGGDPALEFIRKNFASLDKEVQKECFGIIGLFGDGSDLELLIPFTDQKHSSHTRSLALINIIKMKHRTGIPVLIRLLADPEKAIREESLSALKEVSPLFSDLSIDKPLTNDIISLKNRYESLSSEEIGWPSFPGEN